MANANVDPADHGREQDAETESERKKIGKTSAFPETHKNTHCQHDQERNWSLDRQRNREVIPPACPAEMAKKEGWVPVPIVSEGIPEPTEKLGSWQADFGTRHYAEGEPVGSSYHQASRDDRQQKGACATPRKLAHLTPALPFHK